MSNAIGLLEVKGVIAGVEALDAMLKSAEVSFVGHRSQGEVLVIVISGQHNVVSAVLEVGIRRSQLFGEVIAKHCIASPHPETQKVLDALLAPNTFSE